VIIRKPVGRVPSSNPSRRAAAVLRPACSVLALAAAGAMAQGMGSGLGLGYGGDSGSLHNATPSFGGGGGAGGSGGRSFYIVPTFAANTTLTNNVNLSATNKESDLVLGLSPGIQMGGQSGRLRGYLNYALTGNFHARSGESSNFTNSLAASGTAEAIDNWLFIDANASVSQQFLSPFGSQSPNSSLNNDNRTEVRSLSVAPRVQGQIAGQVNYVGRAFYSFTDSGSSQAADSTVWGALLGFDSTTRWSRLSWGLDFSYREARFTDRRSEFDQLNVLSLSYAITPELRATLRGNVETSNLTSFDDETHTGWGGGLRWTPSPRTNVMFDYDQRVFGSSHLYSIDYRTPRTVWAISSRQGLSTGQFNSGRGASTSPFNLLFTQFAAIEPDPVKRAQLVNAFLRANGIDPNTSLATGYLPNQVVLERRNEASMSWLGQRDTMVASVYQTESDSLQPSLLNPSDPFSGGNVIRWRGASLTWSHRLTPRDTLSVSGFGQNSTESIGGQDTTLWSGMAMWSSQVAERVNVALSARYQTQSGTTQFDEAALLATLNMTF